MRNCHRAVRVCVCVCVCLCVFVCVCVCVHLHLRIYSKNSATRNCRRAVWVCVCVFVCVFVCVRECTLHLRIYSNCLATRNCHRAVRSYHRGESWSSLSKNSADSRSLPLPNHSQKVSSLPNWLYTWTIELTLEKSVKKRLWEIWKSAECFDRDDRRDDHSLVSPAST